MLQNMHNFITRKRCFLMINRYWSDSAGSWSFKYLSHFFSVYGWKPNDILYAEIICWGCSIWTKWTKPGGTSIYKAAPVCSLFIHALVYGVNETLTRVSWRTFSNLSDYFCFNSFSTFPSSALSACSAVLYLLSIFYRFLGRFSIKMTVIGRFSGFSGNWIGGALGVKCVTPSGLPGIINVPGL